MNGSVQKISACLALLCLTYNFTCSALDIQELINRSAEGFANVAPLDSDCSQPSRQLSLTSVHTVVAAICTLNSINMTERKNLETSQGENHFHDWDIINTEEGFKVQGYCSKRAIISADGSVQKFKGLPIKLSFSTSAMKKCDPVVKGQVGQRSLRLQFTDDKSVMNSDNSFTSTGTRTLSRIDIGSDFPKDWLNFNFTSPWMVLGNTPENRELALGNQQGIDFNKVRLHMTGSRSLTAALAMRWDFLISGEQAEPSHNLSDISFSKTLLIKIANAADSLSAGLETREMSVESKTAQNVFYAGGTGIDPVTQLPEPYVTKMRGCSDLIFEGTLFRVSALSADRCQQRIQKYGL